MKLLKINETKINNEMKKLYSKRVDEKISIENFKLQYDELKSKLKGTKKVLDELQKKKTKYQKTRRLKVLNKISFLKNSIDFLLEML